MTDVLVLKYLSQVLSVHTHLVWLMLMLACCCTPMQQHNVSGYPYCNYSSLIEANKTLRKFLLLLRLVSLLQPKCLKAMLFNWVSVPISVAYWKAILLQFLVPFSQGTEGTVTRYIFLKLWNTTFSIILKGNAYNYYNEHYLILCFQFWHMLFIQIVVL